MSIRHAPKYTIASVIALVAFGCASDVDESTRAEGQDESPVLALVTSRADQVAEITPETGTWGDWSQSVYCNPGTYAVGFTQRVERGVGDKDDTTLNAVKLVCATDSGQRTETVLSDNGLYGDWSEEVRCAGFVTGGRVKFERPVGTGDDTAANAVQLACSNGGAIAANNDGPYGRWNEWQSCPPNAAVCGIATRNEQSQGGGDDTALNGVRLYCCQR